MKKETGSVSCFAAIACLIWVGMATTAGMAQSNSTQADQYQTGQTQSNANQPQQTRGLVPRTDVSAENSSNGELVNAVQNSLQPNWYPIPADEQEHLDKILTYWQQSSDQIRLCECSFTRWDYDTDFCNWHDPKSGDLAAYAVWRGSIKFAEPDKALYETTEMYRFKLENQKASLEKSENPDHKEKWICDGQYIYEYDFVQKILYDIPIPVEFQGDGLINSPLPFLFGANKDVLNDRFWIRVITPLSAEKEHWLEAIPKRMEDSQAYSRIEIVIAQEDFLPKSMRVFSRTYDGKADKSSQAFAFDNRKINSNLMKVQDFLTIFIRPAKKLGWQRVEKKPLDRSGAQAQQPVGSNLK